VLGIFGASAMLSVLNTITTELFPTSLRADAFAWTNNLIGRIGYVAAPIGVGAVAQVVGEKGPVVAATAIFPMLALLLIFAMIPETRGLELEDTSALEAD
jgi:putative MFS transporter